jgi:hypothetical protein
VKVLGPFLGIFMKKIAQLCNHYEYEMLYLDYALSSETNYYDKNGNLNVFCTKWGRTSTAYWNKQGWYRFF